MNGYYKMLLLNDCGMEMGNVTLYAQSRQEAREIAGDIMSALSDTPLTLDSYRLARVEYDI